MCVCFVVVDAVCAALFSSHLLELGDGIVGRIA